MKTQEIYIYPDIDDETEDESYDRGYFIYDFGSEDQNEITLPKLGNSIKLVGGEGQEYILTRIK